jgi:hypothetical protein
MVYRVSRDAGAAIITYDAGGKEYRWLIEISFGGVS